MAAVSQEKWNHLAGTIFKKGSWGLYHEPLSESVEPPKLLSQLEDSQDRGISGCREAGIMIDLFLEPFRTRSMNQE